MINNDGEAQNICALWLTWGHKHHTLTAMLCLQLMMYYICLYNLSWHIITLL